MVEEAGDDSHVLVRVQRDQVRIIKDVALLISTDPTARAAIESLIPAFLRNRAKPDESPKLKVSTPAETKRLETPKSRTKRTA